MKPFEWARVVCADNRVSAPARAVAMSLALHSKMHGGLGQSEASRATIARWTALSQSSVQRALRSLQAYGYLSTARPMKASTGAQDTAVHAFTTPETVPVAAVDIPPMTREGVSHTDSGGESHRLRRGESHRPPLKDQGRYQVTKPAAKVTPEPLANEQETTEQREWLNQFSYQVGETLRPNSRTLTAASRAMALGHTPATARDAVAAAGNLALMNTGAILTTLEGITATRTQSVLDAEPWRSRLPEQCPHPESASRDLRPNQCSACRRDAMDVA